ncbi:hypothetical protein CU098_011534, partial [Rhizopus stolonifer]
LLDFHQASNPWNHSQSPVKEQKHLSQSSLNSFTKPDLNNNSYKEQQEEEVTLLHHEASEETIEEVSEGLMKKTPLYEAALFNKIVRRIQH